MRRLTLDPVTGNVTIALASSDLGRKMETYVGPTLLEMLENGDGGSDIYFKLNGDVIDGYGFDKIGRQQPHATRFAFHNEINEDRVIRIKKRRLRIKKRKRVCKPKPKRRSKR